MTKILHDRNRTRVCNNQHIRHDNKKQTVRVVERHKSLYHEARGNTHNGLEDKIYSFSIQSRAFEIRRCTNRGGESTSLIPFVRTKNKRRRTKRFSSPVQG